MPPSKLHLEHLDASLVMDFLEHLEVKRGNVSSTRNVRLAAIKSFVRFVEHRVPSLLEHFRRILAIPVKKTDTPLVNHLSMEELQAILNAPDVRTRLGIRDRAMIHLCFAGGLRVSELIRLPISSVVLDSQPTVRIQGKGRKERVLPLWRETTSDLRDWLAARGELSSPQIFVNARGNAMTRSGFEYVLGKHTQVAIKSLPSLRNKVVTPHVLRHTCAMMILQATGDLRKVSLWLGHADMQTTQVYLRADPAEKLDAINSAVPPMLKRTQFRPPDQLVASLRGKG